MNEEFHLDPDKIGFVGFSAGGHLAAMLATGADAGNPKAVDKMEQTSDRVNFLVLGYAWLNAMQPSIQKMITYCSMVHNVSAEKCKGWESQYTPALHVDSNTPPTFLYSTTDDKIVPISASIDFYSALTKAGVSAEMHIFAHGPHGSGLGSGDPNLDVWPSLLENWLRAQHIF